MDLPIHPSVDIYQIHRTPFFRRLHRKDSEEFERLKQAYESVRNFDEKPLQAQVKKIRLGKLLRRIKNSFINSNKNDPSHKARPRPKTKQQIRREELSKARQIGIDYSRQNLGSNLAGYGIALETRNHIDDWKREKTRLERRLEYGNTKSQVNRTKIQRSQRDSQRAAEIEQTAGQQGVVMTSSATKQRLLLLKNNLTRKEFMKFLVHCLSTDKPNPEVLKTFEDILLFKGELYWDLVEAIDQRQRYIKRYGKFMRKLSNLAFKGFSEAKTVKQRDVKEICMETFKSTTSLKRTANTTQEVYIRTYRYADSAAFLPSPTKSLLNIQDDIPELPEEKPERNRLQDTKTIPTTSIPLPKKSTSHLSTKLIRTIRMEPTAKTTITKKFGDVIREAVHKESAVMLANLEKAMKH